MDWLEIIKLKQKIRDLESAKRKKDIQKIRKRSYILSMLNTSQDVQLDWLIVPELQMAFSIGYDDDAGSTRKSLTKFERYCEVVNTKEAYYTALSAGLVSSINEWFQTYFSVQQSMEYDASIGAELTLDEMLEKFEVIDKNVKEFDLTYELEKIENDIQNLLFLNIQEEKIARIEAIRQKYEDLEGNVIERYGGNRADPIMPEEGEGHVWFSGQFPITKGFSMRFYDGNSFYIPNLLDIDESMTRFFEEKLNISMFILKYYRKETYRRYIMSKSYVSAYGRQKDWPIGLKKSDKAWMKLYLEKREFNEYSLPTVVSIQQIDSAEEGYQIFKMLLRGEGVSEEDFHPGEIVYKVAKTLKW
jgi:hypothetical protein